MAARDYPFQSEIVVQFRDIDAMGHVNNAVYFSYLETARTTFFEHFFNIGEALDIPVILGQASCRYLSPARFRERLTVGMGVSRLGNKSFEMVYEVDAADGRPIATARTTMIMYDYAAGRSMPVPEEMRQKILRMQQGWAPPTQQ